MDLHEKATRMLNLFTVFFRHELSVDPHCAHHNNPRIFNYLDIYIHSIVAAVAGRSLGAAIDE